MAFQSRILICFQKPQVLLKKTDNDEDDGDNDSDDDDDVNDDDYDDDDALLYQNYDEFRDIDECVTDQPTDGHGQLQRCEDATKKGLTD